MNKLTEVIKSQIRDKGPITFAEFMELALYHSTYGYYRSGKENIGKEGDFYTSPHVHPAFGKVIGNFILKSFDYIDENKLAIVELGAGKGYLALDILDQIKDVNKSYYDRITYYIVERNNHTDNYAKELFSKHHKKVNLISDLENLYDREVHGIVVSNELFDALPFNRLKFIHDDISEFYVALEHDEFVETLSKPSSREILDYINREKIDFIDGQEFEINLSSKKVLEQIGKALSSGIVMTIDYGFLASELFSPDRIKGTYKCFHKHEINERPYENIGNQDITSHVDFSNLIQVGESIGLNNIHYTTQGQFLVDWGILDLANNATEKDIRAIKNLFLPELMGDKFKVLIQKKLDCDLEGYYPESPFKISFNVT